MANATRNTQIDASGEAEIQLRKISEKTTRFNKVTTLARSFFDMFNCDWCGS